MHFSICYQRPNAEITESYVSEQARGQGVGKKLVGACLSLANQLGVDKVHIRTSPANEAANKLYRQLNFELGNTNVYCSTKFFTD